MFDIITVFSVPLDHIYESSWWVFNPNHFEQVVKWMEHLPPQFFRKQKIRKKSVFCQLFGSILTWLASNPHLVTLICSSGYVRIMIITDFWLITKHGFQSIQDYPPRKTNSSQCWKSTFFPIGPYIYKLVDFPASYVRFT